MAYQELRDLHLSRTCPARRIGQVTGRDPILLLPYLFQVGVISPFIPGPNTPSPVWWGRSLRCLFPEHRKGPTGPQNSVWCLWPTSFTLVTFTFSFSIGTWLQCPIGRLSLFCLDRSSDNRKWVFQIDFPFFWQSRNMPWFKDLFSWWTKGFFRFTFNFNFTCNFFMLSCGSLVMMSFSKDFVFALPSMRNTGSKRTND